MKMFTTTLLFLMNSLAPVEGIYTLVWHTSSKHYQIYETREEAYKGYKDIAYGVSKVLYGPKCEIESDKKTGTFYSSIWLPGGHKRFSKYYNGLRQSGKVRCYQEGEFFTNMIQIYPYEAKKAQTAELRRW